MRLGRGVSGRHSRHAAHHRVEVSVASSAPLSYQGHHARKKERAFFHPLSMMPVMRDLPITVPEAGRGGQDHALLAMQHPSIDAGALVLQPEAG